MLSYLLDNEEHRTTAQTKQAVEFFESKIQDAMLFGDIKRAVASNTDVILFNIDSKADAEPGRDAILAVFLKVLNEMQGYSRRPPSHRPHGALPRRARASSKTFHDAFESSHRARLGRRAGRLRVQPGRGGRGAVARRSARARNPARSGSTAPRITSR